MRAPLWQTDLRGKCFLSPKNTTFFNFRRTDFPKAPLRGFKSTPFTRLSAFFAPWASARQLSRMRRVGKIVLRSFQISRLVIGLPTIDFIQFFNSAAKCCPRTRKTHVFAKNTYLCESRIPHSLLPSCLLAGFISDNSQRPPSLAALRWLRKTWYSVTSTGRAAPIAKENILLSSNGI